jgi:hypothetical protein
MKFEAGRSTLIGSAIVILGFLTAGFLQDPRIHADPEPPPRPPTLQKPQQPRVQEPPQRDDDTIRLGRTLVLLDVTVVDPANKPVMDLKQEEFTVTEDKVPQKIEFFSREQVPVSLVFAIDTSGSMRPKLDTVVKASTNLVKAGRRDDEMAVIEFKDQPELLEEFTGDINDVIDTLNGLVASRQTAMLDACTLPPTMPTGRQEQAESGAGCDRRSRQ